MIGPKSNNSFKVFFSIGVQFSSHNEIYKENKGAHQGHRKRKQIVKGDKTDPEYSLNNNNKK